MLKEQVELLRKPHRRDEGSLMLHLLHCVISTLLCCIFVCVVPFQATEIDRHEPAHKITVTQQYGKPLHSETPMDILLDGETGTLISIKQLYGENQARPVSPLSLGNNVCLYGSQPYCLSRTISGNWNSISRWSVGVRPAQITWVKNGKTHTSPKYSQKTRITISGSPVTVIKVTIS